MEKSKQKDLRFIKAKEKIASAFKSLVQAKKFEDITVSALCKNAGIDRKTFYLHYKTLDDLLIEILDELNLEFARRLHGRNVSDLGTIVREHIVFIQKKGKFFERIMTDSAYSYIASRNVRRFFAMYPALYEPLGRLDASEANVVVTFINTSYFQMVTRWVQDGKKIPMERLINLVTDLIFKGIGDIVHSTRNLS